MLRHLTIAFLFLIAPISAQKWALKAEYFGGACRSAEGNMQWIAVKGSDWNNSIHIVHSFQSLGAYQFYMGRVLLLGSPMRPLTLGRPFLPGCSLYVTPIVISPYPSFATSILKSPRLLGMSYVAQWVVIQKVTGNRTILAFSMTDAVKVSFVKK